MSFVPILFIEQIEGNCTTKLLAFFLKRSLIVDVRCGANPRQSDLLVKLLVKLLVELLVKLLVA